MGIYLNPGNDGFKRAVNSQIYVDKTELISYINKVINTEQNSVCVSRPRRFGKTMAANMLSAYYGKGYDSSELFAPFKIALDESFEKYLNKYNVLFLNMTHFMSMKNGAMDIIDNLQTEVIADLRRDYGEFIGENEVRLDKALALVHLYTKVKFVIIIDEWDCIFREYKNNTELQKEYLEFLRRFLKDRDYVALAYMTGILPIKKYGEHSALNMFKEISMTASEPLEEFVGFTESEVRELCEKHSVDFAEIQRWYDGYVFDDMHVYNPRSVVESVMSKKFRSYWTKTETYEALKVYIDMNFDGLRDAVTGMLAGERFPVYTGNFTNDMSTFSDKDDVLTLLIHLGYLAFDEDTGEVFIPNQEIILEFEAAIRAGGWEEIAGIIKKSSKLLESTINGDADAVAAALEEAHMVNSSVLAYNDENSLSCAITLAYFSARKDYLIVREFPTGKGFADIVFVPRRNSDKPALVVELKWDKSAEGAISSPVPSAIKHIENQRLRSLIFLLPTFYLQFHFACSAIYQNNHLIQQQLLYRCR